MWSPKIAGNLSLPSATGCPSAANDKQTALVNVQPNMSHLTFIRSFPFSDSAAELHRQIQTPLKETMIATFCFSVSPRIAIYSVRVIILSAPKVPGWRNWQTRGTQNPLGLTPVRVQLPPPAPNFRFVSPAQRFLPILMVAKSSNQHLSIGECCLVACQVDSKQPKGAHLLVQPKSQTLPTHQQRSK